MSNTDMFNCVPGPEDKNKCIMNKRIERMKRINWGEERGVSVFDSNRQMLCNAAK